MVFSSHTHLLSPSHPPSREGNKAETPPKRKAGEIDSKENWQSSVRRARVQTFCKSTRRGLNTREPGFPSFTLFHGAMCSQLPIQAPICRTPCGTNRLALLSACLLLHWGLRGSQTTTKKTTIFSYHQQIYGCHTKPTN